jgi:hypothetical protein
MDVRTSDILIFPDNKGTFETRNTIYEKVSPNYIMGHHETIKDN